MVNDTVHCVDKRRVVFKNLASTFLAYNGLVTFFSVPIMNGTKDCELVNITKYDSPKMVLCVFFI